MINDGLDLMALINPRGCDGIAEGKRWIVACSHGPICAKCDRPAVWCICELTGELERARLMKQSEMRFHQKVEADYRTLISVLEAQAMDWIRRSGELSDELAKAKASLKKARADLRKLRKANGP